MSEPRIYREDVELLHDIPCYIGDGGLRNGTFVEDSNPLASHCICHHAVWHSCPNPSVGKTMFDTLPSRPVATTSACGDDEQLASILGELRAIRELLERAASGHDSQENINVD